MNILVEKKAVIENRRQKACAYKISGCVQHVMRVGVSRLTFCYYEAALD
jgi:hypothetical protein